MVGRHTASLEVPCHFGVATELGLICLNQPNYAKADPAEIESQLLATYVVKKTLLRELSA